jgi:hypothetical protein
MMKSNLDSTRPGTDVIQIVGLDHQIHYVCAGNVLAERLSAESSKHVAVV